MIYQSSRWMLHGMVYGMIYRVWYGIWYGLVDMAWHMLWPGEACHGIWHDMVHAGFQVTLSKKVGAF